MLYCALLFGLVAISAGLKVYYYDNESEYSSGEIEYFSGEYEYYDRVNDNSNCHKTDHRSLHCYDFPRFIPHDVSHVYLDFSLLISFYNILTNWENVTFLKIDGCYDLNFTFMAKLNNLEELHIHCSRSTLRLFNDSFTGLYNLKVLSISGALIMHEDELIRAIDNKTVLNNLETFSLLDSTLIKGQNSRFYKSIGHFLDKHLNSLNLNQMVIDEELFFNIILRSDSPSRVNVSFSELFWYPNSSFSDFPFIDYISDFRTNKLYEMELLDISYTSFPLITHYLELISGFKYLEFIMSDEPILVLSRALIVNVSGINGIGKATELYGISLYIDFLFPSQNNLQELIAQNNQLKYINVTFPCNHSRLKKLDLSFNVIEFINPNICLCCKALIEINLSSNHLYQMANRNYFLFERLFVVFENLRYVCISFNKLTEIPSKIFQENMYIEIIDLSHNMLTKITFNVNHLLNLKTLDLNSNRIATFDQISFSNIQSSYMIKNYGTLMLDDNPILCSECDSLPSLKWLSASTLINRVNSTFMCKTRAGNRVPFDHNAVTQLQEECDIPKWIKRVVILCITLPLVTIVFLVGFARMLMQYRRGKIKLKNIEEIVEQIRQNQMNTEFVVFLSYSSEDTDFIRKYVYDPLDMHLHERIRTERDLVCLGDTHFQLGKPINDEMVQCLQKSAVVMLLLSHNFCKSEYCRMEFNHALLMEKPFILMVKDKIDVNEMTPSLQELFRRNTRLLWEKDGDVFVMKTSWNNVICSILELMIQKQ